MTSAAPAGAVVEDGVLDVTGRLAPVTGIAGQSELAPPTGHIVTGPVIMTGGGGTGHRSPVTGHVVTGPVTGQTGHRSPVIPVTGHRAPGTGHRSPGTGHRAPGIHRSPVTPGTGHRATDTELLAPVSSHGPVSSQALDISSAASERRDQASTHSVWPVRQRPAPAATFPNPETIWENPYFNFPLMGMSQSPAATGSVPPFFPGWPYPPAFVQRSSAQAQDQERTERKSPAPPASQATPRPPSRERTSPGIPATVGAETPHNPTSRQSSPAPSDTLSLFAPKDDPIIMESEESAKEPPPVSPEETSKADQPHLFTLNKVFEYIFETLPEDVCPRPSLPATADPETATDILVRKLFPESSPTSKAPLLRLPLSPAVRTSMSRLDALNKLSPSPTWSISAADAKTSELSSTYRPPVKDDESGLDLSQVPPLDPLASAAKLSRPAAAKTVPLPLGMLEGWELRERKSMGLASQMDFLAATLLKTVSSTVDGCPDDLRQALLALARSSKQLAANSATNMAEMLRLRRAAILATAPENFLLQQARDKLLTAPITAPLLFGGRIPEVLASNKEEQLNLVITARAQAPKASGFKRPSEAPKQAPPSKKPKKDPPSSGNRGKPQPSMPKPAGRGNPKASGKWSGKPFPRGGGPKGKP